MKTVYIIKGKVTDTTAHTEDCVLGQTEWQFSDSDTNRSYSADYLNLEKGLIEYSGCIMIYRR